MRVGVISDTHDKIAYTKEVLDFLQSQKISYLLHCGDIGADVAHLLASLAVEVVAVYGNTDRPLPYSFIHKEPYYFTIAKRSCKMMHHPYYLTPDSDYIFYGHLHKFSCEAKKSLYLNPGEVCARNKPKIECAIVDMAHEAIWYAYKDLGAKEFTMHKVCG